MTKVWIYDYLILLQHNACEYATQFSIYGNEYFIILNIAKYWIMKIIYYSLFWHQKSLMNHIICFSSCVQIL